MAQRTIAFSFPLMTIFSFESKNNTTLIYLGVLDN
jgi:hypothetical protein